MDRDAINQMVARAAGGVDVQTTEQVLEGLEKVILSQMGQGGGNKFAKIIALYQTWKK
ncbi:MAG: hypothetical protein FWD99_01115 [Oscillospiraceae bacterium]|nr:hypothetical protein [Oscillospiraceae bacterium]